MIDSQSLEQKIFESEFAAVIDCEQTRIVDTSAEIVAEVVLSDGSRANEVTSFVSDVLKSSGRPFTLVVRRKWKIAGIGEVMPAYGPSGGLRAASLVPVTVVAGSEASQVTVSVTKLAEMEFERILGTKPNLKDIARAVVQSSLQRGGASYWDPLEENYLEVASSGVPNIIRLLKQAA